MNKVMRALAIPLALGLILTACGKKTPTASGTSPSANPCSPAPVKSSGVLTVAAEYPYYAPFLIGKQDSPTGFEADLINGIAQKLTGGKTKWVNIAFDQLYAPGPKQWDVGVSEITITPDRDQAVDFSEPYFTANQGLLVRADSKYASATTTDQLLDAKFGAEAGTTGLDYLKQHVKPHKKVSQFDTTDVTAQALKTGTIDIQVIDVPIAIGIRDESKVPLKVIGQFITNESYGLAMEDKSTLKPCVDQAIKDLKSSGQIDQSQEKYFPGSTDLPEFQGLV
jgi:polar amino acid transport system substrate-binding protein